MGQVARRVPRARLRRRASVVDRSQEKENGTLGRELRRVLRFGRRRDETISELERCRKESVGRTKIGEKRKENDDDFDEDDFEGKEQQKTTAATKDAGVLEEEKTEKATIDA